MRSPCLPTTPIPDLALLRLEISPHPCVYLHTDVRLYDHLYTFGYSDRHPEGDSTTVEYEGPIGIEHPLLKLKEGQIRPGVSGAPLLNLRTGGICGMVRTTRDRSTDLGCIAIPTQVFLDHIEALTARQEQFHRQDGRWLAYLTLEQHQQLPWRITPTANPFYGESPQLLGRDEEVQCVAEKLQAGNHCSIVGVSGSGKSLFVRTIVRMIPAWLRCQPHEVLLIPCRSVATIRELQGLVVQHLGGQRATEWRSLLSLKPLRLLVLDDLGGMDPGQRGLEMRRWLRGLDDLYQTKLLMVSNERLDVLFRKDDPTRDSPLAGLDPQPVVLAPLPPTVCRAIMQQRLVRTALDMALFTDLWEAGPSQPKHLLDLCAARYAALCRGV